MKSASDSCRDTDFAMKAAESVRQQLKIPVDSMPQVGLVLGSGLGQAAFRLNAAGGQSLPYAAIPKMPVTQVSGHCGAFVTGRIHNIPVAILQGRVHCYEGHSMADVEFGTRLLQALGVRILILTNAAGGVREGLQPGDLMLIRDHIRPLAASYFHSEARASQREPQPWAGPANSRSAPAPDMRELLWNDALRHKARNIQTSLRIHEGVYAMMTGPNYETPAEVRTIRTLGADAVGMSTVPEALLAASLGMNVIGVSCITNVAAGLSQVPLNHSEVTAAAHAVERPFVDWLWELVRVVGCES